MRVIFFDIDGVLNSSRTALITNTRCKSYQQVMVEGIDPVAVKLLNRLCKEFDLKLVMSSSHRYDYMYPDTVPVEGGFSRDLVDMFRLGIYCEQLGIDHTRLVGATPDINAPNKMRGDEVQRYLDHHPDVTDYAIIDDINQFPGKMSAWFVQVNGDDGLSFLNYRDLEGIFGTKSTIILPPK